jgi:hypothetical protein
MHYSSKCQGLGKVILLHTKLRNQRNMEIDCKIWGLASTESVEVIGADFLCPKHHLFVRALFVL